MTRSSDGAVAGNEVLATLWSAKRVAEHLGVSTKTVYRLAIPCITLGRKLRRYSPQTVARFVAERNHVVR